MPAWRRGKHSISSRSSHSASGAGVSRQPLMSKSSKITRCSFGKYYCAVCRLVASISVKLRSWKTGTLKHRPSLLHPPLCLRMSGEQWRAGSSALKLHFDVGFCCWLLTWGALLSWSWLTRGLWLNTDMDSVTKTCMGFAVLPPGLTSCLGNEFPQSVVILPGPSQTLNWSEQGVVVLSDTVRQCGNGT